MGERQSGSGVPGRRRVHPGDTVSEGSGGWGAPADATPALEALLAAALRGGRLDADGEQRAVAAFRAARDASAHRAVRTRRRDDWRPRARRRTARSVKATLSVLLGSLALGGVAFAAIGTTGSSSDGGEGTRTRPDTSASAGPSGSASLPSDSRSAAAPSDRPDSAKDTQAHCRAYEKVGGRGKALDATAWQRLVAAAGGEAKVGSYCAGQLAGTAKPESRPSRPAKPATPGAHTKPARPTTPPAEPAKPTQAQTAGGAGSDQGADKAKGNNP
ncbi:hypothetical protein AB0I77_29350 [Streptomyces sp. NPDC050619]|uniref:hypothetical protein n=1 Tax=Streptomyces sp. NPDC050619 TaxID=3157214 RepID=UPI00344A4073